MNLTKNFTLEELYASNTANSRHIDNSPPDNVIYNLKLLATNILQPLRDSVGVVTVNCGYRCPILNKLVGGVSDSQHVIGQAADIKTYDMKSAFRYIEKNLPFDQLIWEYGDDEKPSWIHVSYSDRHRKQVLRCINGKYTNFKLE